MLGFGFTGMVSRIVRLHRALTRWSANATSDVGSHGQGSGEMVMQRLGKAVEAQVSGKALRSGNSAPRIQPRIVSEGEGAATAPTSAVAR